MVDLDRFIGIPEAARRLGISTRQGYRLAESGDLCGVPVHEVGARKMVSLRRLAERMYGATIDDRSDDQLAVALERKAS